MNLKGYIHCPICNYGFSFIEPTKDVTATKTQICPECGHEFIFKAEASGTVDLATVYTSSDVQYKEFEGTKVTV